MLTSDYRGIYEEFHTEFHSTNEKFEIGFQEVGSSLRGDSAYEVAVNNGFFGTEKEWLESLKGKDGTDGVDGKDGYTPTKGVDYFTESDKEELVDKVVSDLLDAEVDATTMTEITYTDLKSLRDNAGLKAGGYYRITDYVTTTVQEATKSAGHPFDILVKAVSETEIETKVSAVLHGGGRILRKQ